VTETAPEALVRSAAYGAPVPFVVRRAPVDGIDASATPELAGMGQVERRLAPGTPVILRRRYGDCAFVWAQDGWMGWVLEAALADSEGGEG
jgi:hypothetical protein